MADIVRNKEMSEYQINICPKDKNQLSMILMSCWATLWRGHIKSATSYKARDVHVLNSPANVNVLDEVRDISIAS